MKLDIERGTVIQLVDQWEGIEEIMVEIKRDNQIISFERAYNYPLFTGHCNCGDQVLVNTTAVNLSLGTGGYHMVMCNLSNPNLRKDGNGHIMKLRYTPYQFAVNCIEERENEKSGQSDQNEQLEGMPILLIEIHSALPILVSTLKKLNPSIHIVYIMTDGGALPVYLSRHVKALRELGWIKGVVTVGHAFGGEMEAVTVYSALLAAKKYWNPDMIIVGMGPGIVGTGTIYGHTGVEQGENINRVSVLNGKPVFVPRISISDHRNRHHGISHHTLTNLSLISLRPAYLPIWEHHLNHPIISRQIKDYDLENKHHIINISAEEDELLGDLEFILSKYPLPITTMNRDYKKDLDYFLSVITSARGAYYLYNR
ncbi:DUF3866 family protein [Microaerobacter geothermalis]|uniref:DUF3866 family protein n=1 Tax=Microaerobacter geothermalis TaxID=674972 RepID=UPI001F320776|nr:DUF3866 family protein [Microaerobacter geothermalis]MCF6093461.1 DUF3866 family protein [Microaerobacter geothermalis]